MCKALMLHKFEIQLNLDELLDTMNLHFYSVYVYIYWYAASLWYSDVIVCSSDCSLRLAYVAEPELVWYGRAP